MIELMAPRDVVSPRPGKQHDSSAPLRPGDSGFEESLEEVCEVVSMTERGHWPSEFLAKGNPSGMGGDPPELLISKLRLRSRRPERLALAVSMDKPWHLGEFLLDELLLRGVKFQVDRDHIQFCDPDYSYTMAMQEIMLAYQQALNKIFDIKYFWKQPRPEDYKQVPGFQFAVDDIGAPGHYGFGAGHAAVAAATDNALHRVLALDAETSLMVTDACWKFAAGRTLLGVHFFEDNEEGYRVGRQF